MRAGWTSAVFSGAPADAEIHLRGFGEGSGSRVLVLVDGLRLNRPDMGGINWLQVPLSAVERVEVLRGGPSRDLRPPSHRRGRQNFHARGAAGCRARRRGSDRRRGFWFFYQGSVFGGGGTPKSAFAASIRNARSRWIPGRQLRLRRGEAPTFTASHRLGQDGIVRAALTYNRFRGGAPWSANQRRFPRKPAPLSL